jgi:hypothetical protein
MTTERTEAQIEREQIEYLFGLTGGELSDKPIDYIDADGNPGTFRYSFDDVPDYAQGMDGEFQDRGDRYVEYFTAIDCLLYSPAKEEIKIGKWVYTLVQTFTSSGETECPAKNAGPDEDDPFAGVECYLCERSPGEEHGYIYLGDGWSELVYRHDGIEHMRTLARQSNMEIWNEPSIECSECGESVPESHAQDHECDDGADRTFTKSEKPMWWFWCCVPGCLPDSDLSGPYDDETEALEGATEGLE